MFLKQNIVLQVYESSLVVRHFVSDTFIGDYTNYSTIREYNMAGPGPSAAMKYMAALSSTWDPFDSKDWDKEKASPACILRIKRYFLTQSSIQYKNKLTVSQ